MGYYLDEGEPANRTPVGERASSLPDGVLLDALNGLDDFMEAAQMSLAETAREGLADRGRAGVLRGAAAVHPTWRETMTTENLLTTIRRAINDPGAILPREDGESVGNWSARAVLATLPADPERVDRALRRVVARLDYDLHKELESDEADGESGYGEFVTTFVAAYAEVPSDAH